MKDSRSFHKKLQEHIDCYAGTDYLTELAKVGDEPDVEQAALNWLALTVLHGLNSNAYKVSLEKSRDGQIDVLFKFREAHLPSPGKELADKVIEIIRRITHIDSEKGELPLAVGIRDSSVDLNIKIKKKDDKEKVIFKFPETK